VIQVHSTMSEPPADLSADRRRYWWIWPALATVLGATALVGMFPGLSAIRSFETAHASWMSDQARREEFRTEAAKERLVFEKSASDQRSILAELDSKVTTARDQLRTKLPELAQLEQARKDLAAAKQERLASEAARDLAKQEEESLGSSVKQLQSQTRSLSAVVADLKTFQAEREQIVKDLASLSQTLSQTRASFATLTDQVVQAKSELATIQTTRASEESKIKAARDNAQEAAVLDSQISQRQQQTDRLKSDAAALQERLDGLRSSLDDELKQATASRDLRKREIDAEIKRLIEARDALATDRAALTEQLRAARNQLADITVKVEKANADAQTASKAAADAERFAVQEKDLQAQVTALKAQVLDANATLTSLRDQETNLRQQIQTLLGDQQAAVTRLQGLAPLLGATFDAFAQQIQRLKAQLPPGDPEKKPEDKR
jgi:predicted  nucleic acid-binding Zn-ribbon protein